MTFPENLDLKQRIIIIINKGKALGMRHGGGGPGQDLGLGVEQAQGQQLAAGCGQHCPPVEETSGPPGRARPSMQEDPGHGQDRPPPYSGHLCLLHAHPEGHVPPTAGRQLCGGAETVCLFACLLTCLLLTG